MAETPEEIPKDPDRLETQYVVPSHNFKLVAPGIYIVRTQAGLRQAIGHWRINAIEGNYAGSRAGPPVKTYPSVVTFACTGKDMADILITAVHVNVMAEAIKGE